MRKYYQNVRDMLLIGQTLSVRFFFAIFSLLAAMDVWLDRSSDAAITLLMTFTPGAVPLVGFWVFLFIAHALMLLKGLSGRYGVIHLLLEAVLGWILWASLSMAYMYTEGHPGIPFAGFLVATWLLIRYPTHWRASRG